MWQAKFVWLKRHWTWVRKYPRLMWVAAICQTWIVAVSAVVWALEFTHFPPQTGSRPTISFLLTFAILLNLSRLSGFYKYLPFWFLSSGVLMKKKVYACSVKCEEPTRTCDRKPSTVISIYIMDSKLCTKITEIRWLSAGEMSHWKEIKSYL